MGSASSRVTREYGADELEPLQRLLEIQKKDENPNLALRITVESGGCHGFQYIMSLSDKFDPDEDTSVVLLPVLLQQE